MARTSKKARRGRGEGSVFFSNSKQCWIWKAVAGFKATGGLRYVQGRAKTQGDALRKKQAAEKGERQPHEDKETVGDHLDHWLTNVAKPNTRVNTWTRYEQIVRLHLKPRIGGTPLRKLSVAQVTRLWAAMSQDKMTAGNIKSCSEVLASALEVAVSEGKILTAPTRGASKPRVIVKPVEVFADEDIQKLLRAAEEHPLEALIVLAIATGAREGELFALDVSDIDLEERTLKITKMLDQTNGKFTIQPPKSQSGVRSISLPLFAITSLKRHLEQKSSGTLFTTRTGSYLPKSNFIRRTWVGLLKKAGVPYRRFHVLRHTHASRLLAAGVDIAEVARRLGDRIETVMRVYAHWVDTQGRDTAGKIETLYGAREPQEGAKNLQGGGKVAEGDSGDAPK